MDTLAAIFIVAIAVTATNVVWTTIRKRRKAHKKFVASMVPRFNQALAAPTEAAFGRIELVSANKVWHAYAGDSKIGIVGFVRPGTPGGAVEDIKWHSANYWPWGRNYSEMFCTHGGREYRVTPAYDFDTRAFWYTIRRVGIEMVVGRIEVTVSRTELTRFVPGEIPVETIVAIFGACNIEDETAVFTAATPPPAKENHCCQSS